MNSIGFPAHLTYYLKDLKFHCSHINFTSIPIISHTSLLGRFVYKTHLNYPLSNLFLRNLTHTKYTQHYKNYYNFQPELSEATDGKILYNGFWQHWKYVDAASVVFEELNNYMEKKVSAEIKTPKKLKSLVVHVRRGDYLQRGNEKTFGVITPSSYKNLISKLVEEYGPLNVITVTDDSDLEQHSDYGTIFGQIITPERCNSWQVLKIMSKADFVVSANSTLSWWGAVLAMKNGGLGFIPSIFHKNMEVNDAFNFPGLLKFKNSFY